MGLLDSFSPEVQALFSAPAEDTEAAIRKRQLLTMGLAMMQNQQMKPLQAIGYGGQVGLQAGDAMRQEAAKQRQQQLASYGQALALQNGIDQRQQTIGARGVVNDFYNGQPQGPAPTISMGPPAPDGSMSPQPAPPNPPSAPGMPISKRDLAAQYQALGTALQQRGYVDQAKQYFDQAEKLAPKLKDTKTLTQNGKRVTVNFYDDGTHEILPDVGPDAEKAHFLDTGNKVGAVDPFTGLPVPGGGLYNKAQTPDSVASNAVTMRGQNMTDARARELRADAQANAGKPQIVTGASGEVYAVDPRSATGQEVIGPDGKPLNKGQKLTEVQGNATAFGMRMKAANSIINKLEDSGYDTSSPKNLLAANMVTNYAASPEAQALHQAKLNFMTASLRKESGAAINKSEFDSENKKYFAQPGDSAAVIKQKRQMRDLALKAMAVQAGPGAKDFTSPSVEDLVKKYAR